MTQKHVAVGGRTLADRSLYEPDIEARLEKNLYRFSPYKDWVTAISSLPCLFNTESPKSALAVAKFAYEQLRHCPPDTRIEQWNQKPHLSRKPTQRIGQA